MAEWLRALGLKSGGPWFKSSALLLSGFVLGSPSSTPRPHCVNSQLPASHQLRFLIVYVQFATLSFLFTASPISTVTTVLNTLDTFKIKLLYYYYYYYCYYYYVVVVVAF